MDLQLTTTTKNNGQIPQIKINPDTFKIELDGPIRIFSNDPIFGKVTPFIDHNILGCRDLFTDWIKKQMGDNSSNYASIIEKEVNDSLTRNYPIELPIPKYDMSVSLFTTGGIKIKENGIMLPLQGTVFKTGSPTVFQCANISDNIDYNDQNNTIQAILGECSILSLVKTIVDKNITREIPGTALGTLTIGLVDSSSSQVIFNDGNIILSGKMSIAGTAIGMPFSVTAKYTAEITLDKKGQISNENFFIENQQKRFISRILENEFKYITPEI